MGSMIQAMPFAGVRRAPRRSHVGPGKIGVWQG